MELESLGSMFWFLSGALSYSIVSSLVKIYKFVSMFKDIESSLITLLKVTDNNYSVFVRIRKRIAKELMEEKPDLFKDVEVVERYDYLQYRNWRRNILFKFLVKIPHNYTKFLDPWLERELNHLRKEIKGANISLEK